MSLIRCFECKKKISIKADVCPNCGCPMNKDYIKELNEIEEQINEQQKIIKEQQETINGIKVQVKGQVEDLEKEKEDLIKKRVLKRKLIKRLRRKLRKEKNANFFKYLFYISIVIIIILMLVICINIKQLDELNKQLDIAREHDYLFKIKDECVNKREFEIILYSEDPTRTTEFCDDENDNSICDAVEFKGSV